MCIGNFFIGNFTITFEGTSTDLESNKEYYIFIVTRFDDKAKPLDSKVFYFAFMPHFKPRDTDLIAELYKLPSRTRIVGAHVTFDVEK